MSQQPSPDRELIARIVALQPELVEPALIYLDVEVCTIGRATTCVCVIRHPLVSRLHARVERQGARYLLADTGSANGTYVNGARIVGSYLLSHDDQIGLGAGRPLLHFIDPDSTLQAGGVLRYDERTMYFWLSGARLDLSPMQFRLLRHLYQHAGDVCSRESCAMAMWGRDYDAGMDAGALDQAMNSLRAILQQADPEANLIKTRRGLGYVLEL